MSLDLNDLLHDWPHEPGSIKVRKILGSDGREKLQLRIDLGLIQMETEGRPDGVKPFDRDSLLEYHQDRAKRAGRKNEHYTLTPDDVGELDVLVGAGHRVRAERALVARHRRGHAEPRIGVDVG